MEFDDNYERDDEEPVKSEPTFPCEADSSGEQMSGTPLEGGDSPVSPQDSKISPAADPSTIWARSQRMYVELSDDDDDDDNKEDHPPIKHEPNSHSEPGSGASGTSLNSNNNPRDSKNCQSLRASQKQQSAAPDIQVASSADRESKHERRKTMLIELTKRKLRIRQAAIEENLRAELDCIDRQRKIEET